MIGIVVALVDKVVPADGLSSRLDLPFCKQTHRHAQQQQNHERGSGRFIRICLASRRNVDWFDFIHSSVWSKQHRPGISPWEGLDRCTVSENCPRFSGRRRQRRQQVVGRSGPPDLTRPTTADHQLPGTRAHHVAAPGAHHTPAATPARPRTARQRRADRQTGKLQTPLRR